jgi:hypothetical protein
MAHANLFYNLPKMLNLTTPDQQTVQVFLDTAFIGGLHWVRDNELYGPVDKLESVADCNGKWYVCNTSVPITERSLASVDDMHRVFTDPDVKYTIGYAALAGNTVEFEFEYLDNGLFSAFVPQIHINEIDGVYMLSLSFSNDDEDELTLMG